MSTKLRIMGHKGIELIYPTDKERLERLLNSFGVGFRKGTWDEHDLITAEEGMDKVEGYACFMTHFFFDKSGKFVKMGAWE